ncbi:hypothetical protein ACEZDB_17745 [Streptacidiphilus sp. N1-3]|uniref:Uncharacterized protein n=1 Tax=Streptacidiphilus alkalitolerans TaxID=3342712 RepID=A0ABV6X3R6_9ACTN
MDLPERTRLMTQLAAMIAVGAVAEYRVMLGAGMARVFDFLHATNTVLTERAVDLPLEGQSTTTPATRTAQGLAVQNQIVGDSAVDAMYANAPADLRHIQELLSANCSAATWRRTCTSATPAPT